MGLGRGEGVNPGTFLELRAALSLPWNDLPPKQAHRRAKQEVEATFEAACTWLAACTCEDSALALSELLFWVGQAKAARKRLEAVEYQMSRPDLG